MGLTSAEENGPKKKRRQRLALRRSKITIYTFTFILWQSRGHN